MIHSFCFALLCSLYSSPSSIYSSSLVDWLNLKLGRKRIRSALLSLLSPFFYLFIITRGFWSLPCSESSSKQKTDDSSTKLESEIRINHRRPKQSAWSSQEDEGIRLLLSTSYPIRYSGQSIKEITCLGYNAGFKGEELITTLAGRTCLLKIIFFHNNNSFIIMMFFLFFPRPVVLHSILISMLNVSEHTI